MKLFVNILTLFVCSIVEIIGITILGVTSYCLFQVSIVWGIVTTVLTVAFSMWNMYECHSLIKL